MWEIVICDSDKSFASKLENHVRNFYQDRKLETKNGSDFSEHEIG